MFKHPATNSLTGTDGTTTAACRSCTQVVTVVSDHDNARQKCSPALKHTFHADHFDRLASMELYSVLR
jgi:hypothetical protein